MSMRYKGGIISATAPTTSTSAASGVWTRQQQMQAIAGSGWPAQPVPGQQAYTTAGTFSWVAPAGVTSVSAVVVNTGSSGMGGNLRYKNNISVIPGNSYTVFVGVAGTNTQTYFINTSTVCASFSGSNVGDGGGNGGDNGGGGAGGGGAGGYSGNGGNGQGSSGTPAATSGSGGGGGGGTSSGVFPSTYAGSGGGGVGLLGEGSSGAGGTGNSGGGGGSGGATGASKSGITGGTGGAYGGAGGFDATLGDHKTGGAGAVRLIWPGNTRSFPSTNTGNL